jgi:integrase
MLTERVIKAIETRDKDYKVADGNSLHLIVRKSGSKTWRFKYRYGDKEKLLTLGSWPAVSLETARRGRDDAKSFLLRGRDPGLFMANKALRAAATADTFEKAGREWHAAQVGRWSKVHAADVLGSLERDVFPFLGSLPINDIDEPLLLAALRQVENRGAIETAHRIRQRVEHIYRYARALGQAKHNPAIDVAAALKPIPQSKRWPALTELAAIRSFLCDIDAAPASPGVKCASRFLALTAQRPGMVRCAQWREIEGVDWDHENEAPEALWRVPSDRMKLELGLKGEEDYEHVVPLSQEAVAVLRAIRPSVGLNPYIFNSAWGRGDGLSENAIGYLYNREGYKGLHVPHGWRSSFSTVMNGLAERAQPGADRLIIDRLIIDLMLAHRPIGMSETEFRYNRSAYMERRREIAAEWAALISMGVVAAAELVEGLRRRIAH